MTAIPVLNKTYSDNLTAMAPVSVSVADIFTSKEFTIQANKAINITVQLPYTPITKGNDWHGLYVATSIKVDSTWYDMGNSGYMTGMSELRIRPERYYNSKYIDLVGENIVSADTDYTIVVKLRSKLYNVNTGNTGAINSPLAFINGSGANTGNRGTRIDEVANQNYVSIIIQEKDRP